MEKIETKVEKLDCKIDNKTEEIKAYVDENFDDIANMFEDVYKRIRNRKCKIKKQFNFSSNGRRNRPAFSYDL